MKTSYASSSVLPSRPDSNRSWRKIRGSRHIDKKDSSLPPYTNEQTAQTLKDRINQSRKFVLLASENSNQSKWVPWELGLADGYKGIGRVAIFPNVQSNANTAWTSWEYLGLYDRIVWGDLEGESERVWMVYNKKSHTACNLNVWLSR
ncbi:TIR domain-containing protein [Croceicoccus hydrothermalis]|uniref:TIR domain-containing protein n=1 Tax=Croceicoccus hydrothermalis TaxID=2867964 RepID=UPI0023BACE41|nr:TIR domain-containing protein [Croceicoccus hydrothermalis]